MKNNPFENFSNLGKVNNLSEEYEHISESDNKDVLEDDKQEKPSFVLFYVFSFLILAIFLFRLLDLQVAKGAKFQYMAEGNRIRSRDISAPRGIIYDKNGIAITQNAASFDLELYPADLPQLKTDREEIYNKINEISQINEEDIKNQVEKQGLYSVDPIVLKENISRDEAMSLMIKYNNILGVSVTARPSRTYANIPGLAQLLGYIGKINQDELDSNSDYKMDSWIGKTGIEKSYESSLKGTSGKEQVEVDSQGRIQRALSNINPVPGNNIYLGIDSKFEQEIANILGSRVSDLKVKSGVVVAMNPKDGTVLGMVSLPSYDNNLFLENFSSEYQKLLDDPNRPLVNRAISGIYPTGSTLKPMIAAAGLQEKVISEDTTINDTGEIKVGEWSFPDWKTHGLTDIRKAIAESCDVFFYAVGGGYEKISGLGVEKIDKYLSIFGFGEKTGIDIPGEQVGLIPDPEWKEKNKKESWYLGDTYHLSIGQGDFLATPLQLLDATAAIANGGELLKPHLAVKETDSQGKIVKEYGKEVIRKDFIDSYNINVVREGMRQTVTSGSAKSLNDLSFEAAGKTGTAQFGTEDKTHAWFTAFAPYNDPEIAIVVLVEEGGEGSDNAVPVGKSILEWYFSHK
jgi:penicillin-binding protein 2